MEQGQVVTATPAEVKDKLEKGEKLIIVDVREDDEVAAGMIPGAKHIRLSEIPERLPEIDRETEAVFVCRSGKRSARACEYLAEAGYKNVKSLQGGMLAWDEDQNS